MTPFQTMFHEAAERFKLLKSFAEKLSQGITERMAKLSERERRVFVLTLVLALVGCLDAGVIRPLKDSFARLDAEIQQEKKKALRNFKGASQKGAVLGAYEELRRGLDASDRDSERIRSAMLQDIERLARENEINLAEVRPQVSREHKDFVDYPVRVQADGRLEQIMKFMADLAATKRLYRVETLRLVPHGEDVNKVRANALLTRIVFKDF